MNIIRDWFNRYFSDPQVVLLVLLIVGAVLAIILLGNMLAPAIAAVVLAFLLDGPADWLRRRGVSNIISVTIVFVSFLTIAFIAFVAILPPITGQFAQFFGLLPSMVTTLQDLAMKLPEAFPGFVDEAQVAELMAGVRAELIDVGQKALQFSLGGITNLITIVVYTILVPVMVFFFLKDRDVILAWLGSFLPAHRPLVRSIWLEVIDRTGDYARGKVYEILIVGFSSWAVYTVIDLRFAAFLALLTGLSVVIPYIGAALVTLPVAFVAFFQWGLTSEFVLAVGLYLVIQALDGNILAPLLFSEVVKLHPNAIIFSILLFGGIWGLWGVFFAIPLATGAHAVIKAWPRKNGDEIERKSDSTS